MKYTGSVDRVLSGIGRMGPGLQFVLASRLDIEVLRLDSTLSPRDEQTSLARLSENRPCIAYVTPERLSEPMRLQIFTEAGPGTSPSPSEPCPQFDAER